MTATRYLFSFCLGETQRRISRQIRLQKIVGFGKYDVIVTFPLNLREDSIAVVQDRNSGAELVDNPSSAFSSHALIIGAEFPVQYFALD